MQMQTTASKSQMLGCLWQGEWFWYTLWICLWTETLAGLPGNFTSHPYTWNLRAEAHSSVMRPSSRGLTCWGLLKTQLLRPLCLIQSIQGHLAFLHEGHVVHNHCRGTAWEPPGKDLRKTGGNLSSGGANGTTRQVLEARGKLVRWPWAVSQQSGMKSPTVAPVTTVL